MSSNLNNLNSNFQMALDGLEECGKTIEQQTCTINTLTSQIKALQGENINLNNKLASVYVEQNKKLNMLKQASVFKENIFPKSRLEPVLEKLVSLGFAKKANINATIEMLHSDPNLALDIIDELSSKFILPNLDNNVSNNNSLNKSEIKFANFSQGYAFNEIGQSNQIKANKDPYKAAIERVAMDNLKRESEFLEANNFKY